MIKPCRKIVSRKGTRWHLYSSILGTASPQDWGKHYSDFAIRAQEDELNLPEEESLVFKRKADYDERFFLFIGDELMGSIGFLAKDIETAVDYADKRIPQGCTRYKIFAPLELKLEEVQDMFDHGYNELGGGEISRERNKQEYEKINENN